MIFSLILYLFLYTCITYNDYYNFSSHFVQNSLSGVSARISFLLMTIVQCTYHDAAYTKRLIVIDTYILLYIM